MSYDENRGLDVFCAIFVHALMFYQMFRCKSYQTCFLLCRQSIAVLPKSGFLSGMAWLQQGIFCLAQRFTYADNNKSATISSELTVMWGICRELTRIQKDSGVHHVGWKCEYLDVRDAKTELNF
ncbi:MAG: hypothetical protein B0W54_02430 [Cellvibrio sp. 79]|nr:MAG: hypothetical protein B0W54_02430 [Cellvibrio sp. 79]